MTICSRWRVFLEHCYRPPPPLIRRMGVPLRHSQISVPKQLCDHEGVNRAIGQPCCKDAIQFWTSKSRPSLHSPRSSLASVLDNSSDTSKYYRLRTVSSSRLSNEQNERAGWISKADCRTEVLLAEVLAQFAIHPRIELSLTE